MPIAAGCWKIGCSGMAAGKINFHRAIRLVSNQTVLSIGRFTEDQRKACGHLTTTAASQVTRERTSRAREGTPRLEGRAEKRHAEGARNFQPCPCPDTAPVAAPWTPPELGIWRPRGRGRTQLKKHRVFFESFPSFLSFLDFIPSASIE